jgi:hypothetical protein
VTCQATLPSWAMTTGHREDRRSHFAGAAHTHCDRIQRSADPSTTVTQEVTSRGISAGSLHPLTSPIWAKRHSPVVELRVQAMIGVRSAVFDGGPFDRQCGDVPLDEGIEAGHVGRVRLGCFQVAVREDLSVQEIDQALSGRASSAKGG